MQCCTSRFFLHTGLPETYFTPETLVYIAVHSCACDVFYSARGKLGCVDRISTVLKTRAMRNESALVVCVCVRACILNANKDAFLEGIFRLYMEARSSSSPPASV